MNSNQHSNVYPFVVSLSNHVPPFDKLRANGVFLILLLILLLFFTQTIPASPETTPAVTDPKVKVTMRDNGYTLGDMIAMHAEFNLAKGLVFDTNSVPLKGPVNNWLDLRDASMTESKNSDGSSKISINFTWQIFGTVEHAQTLKIPAIQLQTIPPTEITKGESTKDDTAKSVNNKSLVKPLAITIPAQGFNLSPVLPPTITENTHRPHAPPLRFNERMPLMFAIIFLSLGLLCGALWLWLQDKISWWPRNPGPITQLARQLSKAGVAQQSTFSAEDVRTINKALASSAGQSLYPDTLSHLFERAPYLAAEKPAITQFFNAAWQSFFTSKNAQSTLNVAETLSWIKRAAMAERLFRASQVKKRTVKVKRIADNKAVKA